MKNTPRLSRRAFLVGSAASIALVGTGYQLFGKEQRPQQSFVTAFKKDQKHFIASMSLDGRQRFITQTPSSCHSVLTHTTLPNGLIGISREPEEAALLLDSQTGQLVHQFKPARDRHFNGHGVCSEDGQLFFASQNDFVNKRGMIAVYRTDNGKQVEEINSYGIGPHELAFLSDGNTLVVANGGIQTHPATGRKELNVPSMHPKLTYVNTKTGELINEFDLPNRKSSIRHLDVGSDDTVVLALQHKDKRDFPAVVGFQKGNQAIKLVQASSDQIHWQMNQYTASVCVHPKTGITAITCPRGNLLTFWDSRDMSYLSAIEMDDPGGVSLSQDGNTFFITSATGYLYHVDAQSLELSDTKLPHWYQAHWGNHFSQLSV